MSRIAGILQNSDDERRMSILAKMAEDFYENKHINSDLLSVNFTEKVKSVMSIDIDTLNIINMLV
jgi:hypothetical protein